MGNSPFSLPSIGTTFDEENKTWSGPNIEPIYSPKVSLGQIIVNSLAKCPNNVGQICHDDNGSEMKNWELLRDSIRVALNLRDLGLKEGDVIGFAAGNSRNIAAVVFGALLNGLPLSTLDPSFGLGDVSHIFKITQPKLVLCDESNYFHVKAALSELQNSAPIYVFESKKTKTPTEWKSACELLKDHPNESRFV